MGLKLGILVLVLNTFTSFGSFAQDLVETKLMDSVSISFDVGSSAIRNPNMFLARVNKLKGSYGKIKLIAYTDTVGSKSANESLASKRLVSVLKLIESSNRKSFVVDTINKNEEREKASNNEENFRRVDVLIYDLKPMIKYNVPVNLKLNFISGTSNMVNSSMENLKILEMLMKTDTTIQIKLNGHVCCEPDMKLSIDRAEKVKSYLVDQGIRSGRISCKGYSNEAKLVPETTELNKRKNMRVDVVFIKPESR